MTAPKTIRVRIPVLVNTEGKWASLSCTHKQSKDAGQLEHWQHFYVTPTQNVVWVEADVPLPVAQVVEGRVEG